MSELSDKHLRHLRLLLDQPDLSDTRYRLIEKLGEGGMGAVWLAEDTALLRKVALKLISVAVMSDNLTNRLRAEARIIASLEHPGIVPVHDLGELPDGRFYYAMKHVQGERLDQWCTPDRSLPRRLDLFIRICEPVAFAHAGGVIHRDLKPENIMVGSFGELLVMDWGIARLTTEPEAESTVAGSPGYMAPEQVAGAEQIDHRADIFALGGVLQYLLTGRAPTDPDDRPVDWSGKKIPRPLVAIIATCRAAHPDDRYPTVQPLIDDIQAWLANQTVLAYPENFFERALRFVKRNKFIVLLVCAYILARVILYFLR